MAASSFLTYQSLQIYYVSLHECKLCNVYKSRTSHSIQRTIERILLLTDVTCSVQFHSGVTCTSNRLNMVSVNDVHSQWDSIWIWFDVCIAVCMCWWTNKAYFITMASDWINGWLLAFCEWRREKQCNLFLSQYEKLLVAFALGRVVVQHRIPYKMPCQMMI